MSEANEWELRDEGERQEGGMTKGMMHMFTILIV